ARVGDAEPLGRREVDPRAQLDDSAIGHTGERRLELGRRFDRDHLGRNSGGSDATGKEETGKEWDGSGTRRTHEDSSAKHPGTRARERPRTTIELGSRF